MRLLALASVMTALLAGGAQARIPSIAAQKISAPKVLGQRAAFKAPGSSKVLEAWVLHNPYRPESTKLTFVN